MILAIDTSTAACTAALFDSAGACVASKDEVIGRGHAERLVPMIGEMIGDSRADHVLVGVGPGSFTGIRVAIAAAHGLAIGWGATVAGMSSLALLAASADGEGELAVAIDGGHGEIFVASFDARSLDPTGPLLNASPADAARQISAPRVIGPAAAKLVGARGTGMAIDGLPSARLAMRLPAALRELAPKPLYARAPDAKVKSAA